MDVATTSSTVQPVLEPQEVDDEDVVVQEINVFLSSISIPDPNNADLVTIPTTTTTTTDHRTYLMQYPGHWNHPTPPQQQQSRHDGPQRESPAVASIRIKPRHNIIEAEHMIPGTNASSNGSDSPNTRTYESQTIPMNTHLCFGKYITTTSTTQTEVDGRFNNNNNDNINTNNIITELHLIPITHVTQMRPSFQHLTHPEENPEEDHDSDENDNDMMVDESNNPNRNPNTATNNNNNNSNTTTITYQRKESDRAIAARKSSYAYQKQSQDNEPFIPLQIVPMYDMEIDSFNNSNNNSQFRRAVPVVVPETTSTHHSIFLPNRDRSLSASMLLYRQSLNYLIHPIHFHPTKATTPVTNNIIIQQQQHPTSTLLTNTNEVLIDTNNERKRILSRIMTILQWNNGPIPFSILLLSIQSENDIPMNQSTTTTHSELTQPAPAPAPPSTSVNTATTTMLLTILNSIAVLVRGNWYIHSKFMKILPHPSILRSNRKQASSSISLLKGPPISSSSTSVIIVGSNTNHQQFLYKQLQQRIRTFALLLLHLYGKIYKARFIQAYNSATTTNPTTTTTEHGWTHPDDIDIESKNQLCTILLHQIAKPTKEGYWVGTIQEDTTFSQLYPDTVQPHEHYWNHQQAVRFQKELLYYNANNN